VCFNEDIRDMSFPPTPNKIFFNGEQQKRSRKPFHIAKESLFPFFSRSLSRLSFRSLSFSSRTAFVVVTLIKEDLIAKRERFAVKLFQIRKSCRTRDDPYFRGTNRVASNLSFANVWSTGAVLLIRVVSSFSSRVKSAVNGVNIVIKRRENKSFSEKPLREKNEHILLH
tara:strand:- start:259 stop:765 length:507 start_codon:yes stop_codon:yes gene_type:complete